MDTFFRMLELPPVNSHEILYLKVKNAVSFLKSLIFEGSFVTWCVKEYRNFM